MGNKDAVLYALSQEDEPVSGEVLAAQLGVSRAAIWKAVNALREEGHAIDAQSNRGYVLRNGIGVLTESGLRKELQRPDRKIELLDEVDSTNTCAKALAAQGAPEGTLVIADCQREGRGRFGRRFHSPKGSGLYMSLVLRPRLPAEQAVRVTVIAAVAVAQAVEDMAGGSVEIKWVNDLFAGGKKLCGILTEAGMDFESGQLEYCVVGIGINVNKEAYPQEIAEIATSIQEQWGMPVSRCRLAAKIVNRIEEMMEEPMNEKIMEEYRCRSNVLGRLVTVSRGDQRFDALAMRIDDDGGLVVRTEDGDTTLRSGEVSLKVKP